MQRSTFFICTALMEIKHLLENTLRKEPNYLTDNGDIKKWVVISKAQNFDETLLSLLISEPRLKTEFFKEIQNHWIFDQNRFADFIEQKEYLEDSFTRYKNKIGLSIGNKFLSQRNEVSLVWPYKDCILEGGQSREEQKRNEIFFNELLAQDEITQLLEPKVLTNPKHFTLESEQAFEKFNRNEQGTITDNLLIKGNNLLALHSLKKEFTGKVKLIYIDPPYYFRENKGNDAFTYNSNFKLSSWLTFMRSRLIIAQKLLSKEGILFVQIDDDGQAHLKILIEEIFGSKNFVANFIWTRKKKGSFLSSKVRKMTEYIICFQKDENVQISLFGENAYTEKLQPIVKRTNSQKELFIKREIISTTLKDGFYENGLKGNTETGVNFLNNFEVKNGLIVSDLTFIARSVWSQEFLDNEISLGSKITLSTLFGFNVLRHNQDEKFKAPSTLINDKNGVGTNEDATAELAELFNTEIGEIFSYNKPVSLLKYLINMVSQNSVDNIILDFFAGSGTTAQAVLDLNKEDGGNRQFILCEQMDYIEKVTTERIKKVIEKNQEGSFIYFELKKYNEIFIEQIQEANTAEQLLAIWEAMKEHSFLNYNIDIKAQDAKIEEFKALNIEQQKQLLVELLDKNQLYVPLSAINDAQYTVTEEEKTLTKAFYKP
jgi:adenine-specific DNA-methyltransferase